MHFIIFFSFLVVGVSGVVFFSQSMSNFPMLSSVMLRTIVFLLIFYGTSYSLGAIKAHIFPHYVGLYLSIFRCPPEDYFPQAFLI